MKCYALRKKLYKELAADFDEFLEGLKLKFLDNYLKQVYWPLIKIKNNDI
jgi:hypothetical protein